MSMFHVGQRVVCVSDARTSPKAAPYRAQGYIYPEFRMVYTIRAIGPIDMDLLLLEEIHNPAFPGTTCEPGFSRKHFRPVKDTSIEVFRKLLAPLPEKADA